MSLRQTVAEKKALERGDVEFTNGKRQADSSTGVPFSVARVSPGRLNVLDALIPEPYTTVSLARAVASSSSVISASRNANLTSPALPAGASSCDSLGQWVVPLVKSRWSSRATRLSSQSGERATYSHTESRLIDRSS